MEFKEFKKLQQQHIASMMEGPSGLFVVDVDKDELWELYLNSFPPGTNDIFRERREFDCSCCRHFVRSFGNVVVVVNYRLVSIWDFKTNDDKFQPVLDVLSQKITGADIADVFVTKDSALGTDKSHERLDDGTVRVWEHFRVNLLSSFVDKSGSTVAALMGQYRDTKNVFQRSLDDITEDAVETVLDLISQKSLYKGEEWKAVLTQFLALLVEYNALPENEKNTFCWVMSVGLGGAVSKIRNHSMGVLLTELSNGVDINDAVRRYEKIVAPTNYKRPKAVFTKKMVQQAQEKLAELGLLDSLERRFATIDDITVNNILFANRNVQQRISDDVFAELRQEAVVNPKRFDKLEEVTIEHFVTHILPRTIDLEICVENSHIPNFVSVIAPKNEAAKTLFKWDNAFSWAYNGNITDSMKERVKARGGNVEGVLRFSLQWNEDGIDNNDLDAHCIEPEGNKIYFRNMRNHRTTGILDVDVIQPYIDVNNEVAVENITWSDINSMQEGEYTFIVHNFTDRGGKNGFSAEIEYAGQIHSFEYRKKLRTDERVLVAVIRFSKTAGIEFVRSLPSTFSSKTVWGIATNQWQPVSLVMYSPNYWNEQHGAGHKHYFFLIDGCKADDTPNGFFNEFLREDMMQHKRVFEALGNKMRVTPSEEQLSGIGFSSTKHNHLVVKVEGHMTRVLKVVF